MMAEAKRPQMSGMIVRKGEEAASTPAPKIDPTPATAVRPPLVGTIAVTVRLDPDRYQRLKSFSNDTRRTNQEHIVEALDDYLRKHGRAQ
jgi:hypothetical protein